MSTMELRAPWSWRRLPPWLIVLGVSVVALGLRLFDLGVRAMHHDESLHAKFAWDFAEGRGYVHNPLMHGPLLFDLVAGVFVIGGDSEFTARLPFAVAGALLVLTPLLLRRWLGTTGVVVTAVLLALSPVLLYYSRFVRNDVLVALLTVLLIAAIWRYREEGRDRWLVLAAASLALSFAAKETTYLVAALLLLYLNATLTAALIDLSGLRGDDRWRAAVLLFPIAWLVAALWWPLAPLRRRLEWSELPREGDLLVVVGTLTLPFLVAALQIPFAGLEDTGPGNLETGIILAAIAGSAVVGLLWDPRRWLPLAVLAALLTVPLFTTWFTNLDGFKSGFWGQLDYWLDQQEVQRGNQPGFYYLMMLPLYEFLPLIPALAGGAWLLLRGDRLTRLFAWWFVATLIALSLAGEKMPWLTVHLAVPLAFLAGRALGLALPAVVRRLRSEGAPAWSWMGAGVAVAAGALLFGLSLRTALDVSFGHPDTPVEPLIYTQTSPDVPVLAREIEDFVAAQLQPTPVIVDTTASITWPWAWYLRHLPNVGYLDAQSIRDSGVPDGAIVISEAATIGIDWPQRDEFEEPRPYVHRWWFPEGGYKGTTFGSFIEDLGSGALLSDWASLVVEHADESSLGALRGDVWFPLEPGVARR